MERPDKFSTLPSLVSAVVSEGATAALH